MPYAGGTSDVIARLATVQGAAASEPKQVKRTRLYVQLLILDLAGLALAWSIACLMMPQHPPAAVAAVPLAVLVLAFLANALNSSCYAIDALRSPSASAWAALTALLPGMMLVVLIAFLVDSSINFMRFYVIAGLGGGLLLVMAGRLWFPRHARHAIGGDMVDKLVIVDGRPAAGWEQIGPVVDAGEIGLRPDLSDPDMLHRFGMLAAVFDDIVVDALPERRRDWSLLLKGANVHGEIVTDTYDELKAIGIGTAGSRSSLVVSRRPLSLRSRMYKRAFDLAFTVPLIIALLPVFAITALAIKLDTPGPVLFKQNRIGRGNRLFKVLKFRSMRVEGSDPGGVRSTQRNDDRITRVGRIIRATSIDELPQFFNVLIGDMSLVGPRPHPIGSLAEGKLFWDIDITYWQRHQFKPGITGLAQVRGFRGATHQLADLNNRLEADMEYIQRWTLWSDVRILVRTLTVLVHKNAF